MNPVFPNPPAPKEHSEEVKSILIKTENEIKNQ